MKRLVRYTLTLARTVGGGLAVSAGVVALGLAMNWSFLVWMLTRLGGSASVSALGATLTGGSLILLFGLVLPLLYLPLAKYHGARMTAVRMYRVHRDVVDRAVLELVRASREDSGGTEPRSGVATAVARVRGKAADWTGTLRQKAPPVALVLRFALRRGGVQPWLDCVDRVAAAGQGEVDEAVALAAIHTQMEDVLGGGSERVVGVAVAGNVLFIVGFAFITRSAWLG